MNVLQPLATFSQCHADIVSRLQDAGAPPHSLSGPRARELAGGLLSLFNDQVLPHHADEECELFPTVRRRALAGAEAELVQGMVDRLVREHRHVERLWHQVEPSLHRVVNDDAAEVDADLMASLVRAYLEHVRFEEEHFLPLARQVLGRSFHDTAALGLAMHLRHVRQAAGMNSVNRP